MPNKRWLKSGKTTYEWRRRGDAARDTRDWPSAEAAYRMHLKSSPGDVPIWVQFGHALKEQGKHQEALWAYRSAVKARPEDEDAKLHLASLMDRLSVDASLEGVDDQVASSMQVVSSIELPTSSNELQEMAAAARAKGDWTVAAMMTRRLLSGQPRSVELHLQYGDMLRELGLFVHARTAYEQAGILAPHDPLPLLRRAALAQTRGAFGTMRVLLKQASDIGADISAIEQDPLHNLEAAPLALRFEDEPKPTFRVFLSSAVTSPRSETAADLATFLGVAHYSYSFMMKGYIDALNKLGISYEVISNPEYIPSVMSISDCTINIHLGFYPPDAQRILKGAYNVAVVAWEFERLPLASEIISYHAFSDPNKMLALPDEVWSISSFGTEAIRSAALSSLYTVPAPVLSDVVEAPRSAQISMRQQHRIAGKLDRLRWVPLAIMPQMLQHFFGEEERRATNLQDILFNKGVRKRNTIFVSILNVHDYRKQIRPVVEAFLRIAKNNPEAVLLLKLSVGGKPKLPLSDYMFRYQMTDGGDLPPPYVSDRIWMTADVLSRDEMSELYDLADFYVSTPHGEGQNLPLIEAMARGVVPVSVDHTAMQDYIRDDNAVVVPSTLAPFTTRLADRYKMSGLRTYYVSAGDVFTALSRALALSPAEYATKSGQALTTVRNVFGLAPFETSVKRAIQSATTRLSDEAPR